MYKKINIRDYADVAGLARHIYDMTADQPRTFIDEYPDRAILEDYVAWEFRVALAEAMLREGATRRYKRKNAGNSG